MEKAYLATGVLGSNSSSNSNSNSNAGKLRRSRTVQTDTSEVDFQVQQFLCHDGAVLSRLGNHSKEFKWKILVGSDPKPIELRMYVDKSILSSPHVGIKCNGKGVFPMAEGKSKAKMRQDFSWMQPFRGLIRGIGLKNVWEFRGPGAVEQWYACEVTAQREDGLLELVAHMPEARHFQAARPQDIRDAVTGHPLQLPRRTLTLEVPMCDPLKSIVSVDNRGITHLFARPTPPPVKGEPVLTPTVHFTVSRDRQTVSADVGPAVLSRFMSGEVTSIGHTSNKLKSWWKFKAGPYAEHSIKIEKKWKSSKIATLTVDGDILVEAAAEDIDSGPDVWECTFHLVGKRCLEFQVYETNRDGEALSTTGTVPWVKNVTHKCVVSFPRGSSDLTEAKLTIDDVNYLYLKETPMERTGELTETMTTSLVDIMGYGITVPYRVDEEAATGLAAIANKVIAVNENAVSSLVAVASKVKGIAIKEDATSSLVTVVSNAVAVPRSLFAFCCGHQAVPEESVERIGSSNTV